MSAKKIFSAKTHAHSRPNLPLPAGARAVLAIPVLLPLLLVGVACGGNNDGITVFAAASLQEAFRDLAHSYQQSNPAQTVNLNFDGSQRLSAQLLHGAPADVFAPADWQQMDAVASSGLLAGPPLNFASNQPVFLVNAKFAAGLPEIPLQEQGMPEQKVSEAGYQSLIQRLAEPGVKIVLAAAEAPAGRYSDEILAKIAASPQFGLQQFSPRLAQNIRANIVSRETSVRGVAQKVALGEADAGITYLTDALPDAISQATLVVTIPDPVNVTAHYPIAPLTNRTKVSAFIDFILSPKGQQILTNHGFGPPSQTGPAQKVPSPSIGQGKDGGKQQHKIPPPLIGEG